MLLFFCLAAASNTAQVFALEETLNINYFELVTNIFKKNKRK